MFQKKIFTFVIFFCIVWSLSGCNENTLDPIRSTGDPTNMQLQAIIGINDNPVEADRIDSVLINSWTVLTSIYSTGNIMRREWKVYRYRTGQLIHTDTAIFLEQNIINPDTLIYRLKVFGYNGPGDTSSRKLTLRFLTSFGVGSSGDISLWNYSSGTYKLLLPYGRINLQSLTNPKSVGSHTGWNNPTTLTDSVVGRGYLLPITAASHTVVEFNYFAGQNIWSIAQGSAFKTPGSANTYSVKFIDGNIYPVNVEPPSVLVGRFGDTVARYDATMDSLIFYPNHRWIPQPIGTAWMEINLYGFVKKYQVPYGTTGYGRFAVPISLVRTYQNQIKFRFGGNQLADMTQSPIHNNGYLSFQFVSPRPQTEPWQPGDKIQMLGPQGLIEEFVVR